MNFKKIKIIQTTIKEKEKGTINEALIEKANYHAKETKRLKKITLLLAIILLCIGRKYNVG